MQFLWEYEYKNVNFLKKMLPEKEFILEDNFNQDTLSFVEHIIPCFRSKICVKNTKKLVLVCL